MFLLQCNTGNGDPKGRDAGSEESVAAEGLADGDRSRKGCGPGVKPVRRG